MARPEPRGRLRELAFGAAAAASTVLSAGLLVVLLLDVLAGGGLPSLAFATGEPADAGRAGGIAPVLVATGWIVGLALVVAVPVGLGAAVYLAEFTGHRFARWVGASLDVLAGVPSVVFGLFGASLFCGVLQLGFSLLSGGLTLACMVLPTVIRTAEAALRSVPASIRAGARALALSRVTTLRRLLLPAAAPGIAAGVVLALGRALAETAALVFTSGYVLRMPDSPLDSGRALSVHIYDLAMNVPGGTANAYRTALVLVAVLVVANASAQMMTERLLARGAR